MKKLILPLRLRAAFFLPFLLLALLSCEDKVEITRKYVLMEPVYMTPTEIRASFEITEPVEIANTGKIYLYDGYLFVNEPGEGIHVIDNSDPSNPQKVNFINIPGNFDLAARGGFLFADSYVDLVVLDIRDVTDIKLANRMEDIFENFKSTEWYDPQMGIVVDWVESEVIEVTEEESGNGYQSYFWYQNRGWAVDHAMARSFNSTAEVTTAIAPSTTTTGVGGSMARFTIVDDNLYTIDHSNMQVFGIADLENPVSIARMEVGWGIETIFPYQDKLFIGAMDGMYIYDNSNPNSPELLSRYEHVMSCDPVVVQDTIAYVTLRDGTTCRGFTNQLEVINIKDPRNPEVMAVYPMSHPHGLGIDGNALFICEGQWGLKVFDATDPLAISSNLLTSFNDIHAFDVIPYEQNLILIGQDGLYQYSYEDLDNIHQISMLPVYREEI